MVAQGGAGLTRVGRITVIIPFFQRKPGLLAAAVGSVLAGRGEADVKIIVVDDGSPLAAEDELGPLGQRTHGIVEVIHQKNAGVAAARNTGLDAVDSSTEYVAFLDADDVWLPSHLVRMQKAFAAGAEFYFSDACYPSDSVSRLTWGRISEYPRRPLDPESELWWLDERLMTMALHGRLPVMTSTVAYKFRGAKDVRFSLAFRRCSEDSLFWIELTDAMKNIVYSPSIDVIYGEGVSMFKAAKWANLASLERCIDASVFHSILKDKYKLSEADTVLNLKCLNSVDCDFFRNYMACLARSKIHLNSLFQYLSIRPLSFLVVPKVAAGLLLQAARKSA